MALGSLRPITDAHLLTVLELLLNTLVSLSLPYDSASIEDISSALQDEHDIPRSVTEQVMGWFGALDMDAGTWSMNAEALVKQIGIALLNPHKVLSSHELSMLI
jgi:sister chromatid cohesion protein DCC1